MTHGILNYTNPEWGRAQLSIQAVVPTDENLTELAAAAQLITAEALTNQLPITPEQIAKSFDYRSPSLLADQARLIWTGGSAERKSEHVEAIWETESRRIQVGRLRSVVGVGTAALLQPTSNWRQFFTPTAQKRTEPEADISNIFVRPRYQARGIGSAILHTLLDSFPRDIRTSVYALDINPDVHETLSHLDFARSVAPPRAIFGERLEQIWFRGPSVGALKLALEDRHPWLKRRLYIPNIKST